MIEYLGLKPNLADPTLMSTGYLKPQLVDEMSMRAGIDQANRANTGALGSVTGGSASAQRAGLLGGGSNYMNAINNAFLQGNMAKIKLEWQQTNLIYRIKLALLVITCKL